MRIIISKFIRENLLESLADLEHRQWISLAKFLLKNENISEPRRKRWKKLFVPYNELSEKEKDQDREYAYKVIRLLKRNRIWE